MRSRIELFSYHEVGIGEEYGSSGKRVPGVVEVVEPEFEILHVAEAIGLAFHGLDFVIEAFQRPIGYIVGVIPEQSLHAVQHG